MRLLGREIIDTFCRRHTAAKGALDAWMNEAKEATWSTPHEIKERYGSADFLSGNRVIFNIKGNHYRLVVVMTYRHGIARVQWVGTHAEYSKKRF